MTLLWVVAAKVGADQFLHVTMLGLCHVTLHRWGYGGVVLYAEKYGVWKRC